MHWREEVTQELIDTGYLKLFVSSRYRIYPLDATKIITLATGGAANRWGSWTEVIPAGLIPFTFAISGQPSLGEYLS